MQAKQRSEEIPATLAISYSLANNPNILIPSTRSILFVRLLDFSRLETNSYLPLYTVDF